MMIGKTARTAMWVGAISTTIVLAGGLRAEEAITRVDPQVGITKLAPMTELAMPGQPPVQGGEQEFFRDSSAAVGVWEGGPGVAKIDSYPVDEFWWIVEGSIVFTDTKGKSYTFKAGDCFVLHKGFSGITRMPGKMRKVYVALGMETHGR